MLFQIILPLKAFSAHFATKSQFRTFVGAFVNHQVVRFGKPPLAVLAHKLALGPHLSPELVARHVVIYLHYGEHLDRVLFLFLSQTRISDLILWKGFTGFSDVYADPAIRATVMLQNGGRRWSNPRNMLDFFWIRVWHWWFTLGWSTRWCAMCELVECGNWFNRFQ